MSKHTPGPWKLDGALCELTGLWRIRFSDNIPHLPEPERKLGVAVVGSEANARLIAAAPEMMAALRRALDWMSAAGVGHPENCAQERDNLVAAREEGRPLADCTCWVSAAEAAIAKAEGCEP